eukprot:14968488-Heterocapsa_arctica.AAC.1
MLEYSRDAMAGPMDALRGLVRKIHAKQFMPDSTRSGRWALAAVGKEPPDEGFADDDGRRGISTWSVGSGGADDDERRGRSTWSVGSGVDDENEGFAKYGPSPSLAVSPGKNPGVGPGEASAPALADGPDGDEAVSPTSVAPSSSTSEGSVSSESSEDEQASEERDADQALLALDPAAPAWP